MRMSHASSESRNDVTMMSIATIRLKLTTIAEMLNPSWLLPPRSCCEATIATALRDAGTRDSARSDTHGTSHSAPASSDATAA